jgi:hypothetical protein
VVKARRFHFGGEAVREVRGIVKRTGGVTTITDARLIRPEGEATAASLVIDDAAATMRIEGLVSSVFPAPVARWFNRPLAATLDRFDFTEPPNVRMRGTLAIRLASADANDLTIDLTTRTPVHASLVEANLKLENPSGRITTVGRLLRTDISSRLPAGSAWRDLQLREPTDARFIGSFPLARTAAPGENWQLFLTGPTAVDYQINDDLVPLQLARATVDFRRTKGEHAARTLQVEAVAKVRAGGRFREAALVDPADAAFQGIFALDEGPASPQTRWSLSFRNPGTTELTVAGKNLPLQQLAFVADFHRDSLDVSKATARLLGGSLTASAQVDRLSTTKTYSLAVHADNVSFPGLVKIYSPETATDGQFSGGFRLNGRATQDSKPRGTGNIEIKDGDIFALPLLGPLSPLLAAVLPGTKTGYSKARRATSTFSLADGVLVTRDFEATTGAFVFKLDGNVNLASKKVDLDARVNTRGPTGLLLYPVSKLLEFEAHGTTADPEWRSRVLSLPGRLLPDFGRRPEAAPGE